MENEVLIISSSESETDPNSDFELDIQKVSYLHPPVDKDSKITFSVDTLSDHLSKPWHNKPKTNGFEFSHNTITESPDGVLLKNIELFGEKDKVSRQDVPVEMQNSSNDVAPTKSPDLLTVVFDKNFYKEKHFGILKESLESTHIPYSVEEMPVPSTVWWKNSSQSSLIEKQIIQYINGSEITSTLGNLNQDFTQEPKKYFLTQAQAIFKKCGYCQITFVIFGMEKYFKSYKSHKAQEFHDLATGEICTQPTKVSRKKKTFPSISKIDFEEALIDLQLQVNANFRLVENITDFSDIIASFTTSIQNAPSKRAKQEHGFSWHVHGSSSGTVKVDKSTAGLCKLWVEQLLQFNNVSKDVAQAIASKYPSPQALLMAYQNCSSRNEAAKLLQNIEVRRGVSVLSTSKQVGPELSHKIHALLTTKNPEEELLRI